MELRVYNLLVECVENSVKILGLGLRVQGLGFGVSQKCGCGLGFKF